MNTLLIFLALSCPKTEIVNTSGFPWNDYDQSILTQAKRRCGELYSDAPCVKWMKKYEKFSYSVLCGSQK
jgi:hypothetical protein